MSEAATDRGGQPSPGVRTAGAGSPAIETAALTRRFGTLVAVDTLAAAVAALDRGGQSPDLPVRRAASADDRGRQQRVRSRVDYAVQVAVLALLTLVATRLYPTIVS